MWPYVCIPNDTKLYFLQKHCAGSEKKQFELPTRSTINTKLS